MTSSIAPWLTVGNSSTAIEFYKSAFGAIEIYRLEISENDLIAKLAIDGAEFWVSNGIDNIPLGGENVRMILTVADPDALFSRALKAGAIQIYPVREEHNWRIGRLADPYGLHWEIGHPVI